MYFVDRNKGLVEVEVQVEVYSGDMDNSSSGSDNDNNSSSDNDNSSSSDNDNGSSSGNSSGNDNSSSSIDSSGNASTNNNNSENSTTSDNTTTTTTNNNNTTTTSNNNSSYNNTLPQYQDINISLTNLQHDQVFKIGYQSLQSETNSKVEAVGLFVRELKDKTKVKGGHLFGIKYKMLVNNID